jgi:hypothetical protein
MAFPMEPAESMVAQFEIIMNPFSHMLSKTLKVHAPKPTFGLELRNDELYNQAYVYEIKDKSDAQ